MKRQDSDIEQIKRYLRGEFSSDEQQLFNRRLTEEPLLNDALAGYIAFPEALEQQDVLEKKNPFTQKRFLYLGLSFGVILVSSVSFFIPENQNNFSEQIKVVNNVASTKEVSKVLREEVLKPTTKSIEKTETYSLPKTEENVSVSNDNSSSHVVTQDTIQDLIDTLNGENLTEFQDEIRSQRTVNQVGKEELNLEPYFAFTDNKLKFMLLKPLNKGSGLTSQSKKSKKEQLRLEKEVNLALNALYAIKKAEYEKAEVYLADFKKMKDSDPEMLSWLSCLKNVQAKEWTVCDSSLTLLSQNLTSIGLQSKRLKLEIEKNQH